MDRGSDDFQSYSELFRLKAAAQDFADLQDAIANRDVGRQRRHIHDKDIEPVTGEKRKSGSSAVQRTLEWLLLNDASYAAAHKGAMIALTDAESSVADGLAEIIEALSDQREALGEMEERAARLPDGTLVFRNADGEVVDADNNPIPDEQAAGIEWTGAEPTYEDYRSRLERIEALEHAERELRGIETELGDIRGELTDQQEPPTEDRVGELEDRATELRERAEQLIPSAAFVAPSVEAEGFTQETISRATVPIIPVGS